MMSRDPKSNETNDNFLENDEMAELLENLDGHPAQNSANESFDDLDNLFVEDSTPNWEDIRRNPNNLPERITFSELPSDDEISEIFSENFSWNPKTPASESIESGTERDDWADFPDLEPSLDENSFASQSLAFDGDDEAATFFSNESTSTSASDSLEDELASFLAEESMTAPESDSLEDELASFLAEDPIAVSSFSQTTGNETESPTLSSDWDELKQLLSGDDDDTEESYSPFQTSSGWNALETSNTPAIPIASESENLFNDSFDDLAALLEQPTAAPTNAQPLGNLDDADMFADLEAALGSPSPVTPVAAPALDDEFGDLEQLLGTDAAMGVSPANSAAVSPRVQTRPRPPKTKQFDQTMRVPVKQLDNLSNLIGELVVKRNALEDDEERLRQSLDNLLNQVQGLSEMGARMHDLYERTLLEGALLASRERGRSAAEAPQNDVNPGGDLDALEMDRFTGFHLLSQEMIELIVRIRESTSDIQFLVDDTDQVTRTLRQVTTQLQEGMTKSRMVSFAQTADRLPRAIREVSIRLNKQAKLIVEGKDVLIDKMILEQLYNPMTHLVNNAIAHGIESPEERAINGKPPEGRVTVRAFIQGNQTVITVSDDGAGINPERVKFKAIEKGLITQAQARALTKQEVYDFLFHPGFSTKDSADDFAGRGVGLDVVYTNLSEIRGTVSIDSAIGKGTTFTIRLPLTLSICKALCCVSERSRIAFPIDGVEDTKDYLPSEIFTKLEEAPSLHGGVSLTNEEERKCVRWREMELPLYTINELLNYNRQVSRRQSYLNKSPEDLIAIVILRSAGNLLALQVDRVLGEQEIVIKQIEGPIPKTAGIAGATVLGDGSVMPIGDVLELIEIAQGRMRTDTNSSLWKKTYVPMNSEGDVRSEPTVLIVDDSITVRQLLSLSFSKVGYRVEQARDGQEALEKLQSNLPCDIVFCDIEMPRMNGLELLSHLQQDERLSAIPVALLTSRGAQRHRTVAAKLGASGYFTKPYTERDLLDAAARMLKGEVLLPGSTRLPRVVEPELEAPAQSVVDRNLTLGSSVKSKADSLVLIVDDSVMVREMLSMTFSKSGYRVEQARDGQEAWEKLRAGLSCSLILCDIEMPRMNGLELLSRIQEDESLSTIPMAMITSRGAQKMQNLAAEKGAKGYFVKPYIEEVLLDAAKRLMAGEVLLKKTSAVEE
jgi:chemotaxis protein histidine kinase CheA/DNA-binding response OmpR family regulator